jgi:deoxyribose-phosphate aldolase
MPAATRLQHLAAQVLAASEDVKDHSHSRESHQGPTNPGIPLDLQWVKRSNVNLPALIRRAETHSKRRSVKKKWQAAWLLRAIKCIDLTTLAGDDTDVNVNRLCAKARVPIRKDLLKAMEVDASSITTGAVCVYPNLVPIAAKALKGSGIPIASVATGFPAGQTPLKQRLAEIHAAIEYGATEIDIVIPRWTVLAGDWEALYEDVKACKEACGDVHMKTILAIGECGTMTNVYKASLVSMMAGSDFIKTSTGKEGVNATFEVALVMVRAIRDYFERTGYYVGFKPAGGIKSAKDCLTWLALMKEELGDEWTHPELSRMGASSLVIDIERQLFHYVHGQYAAMHDMPMS